MIHVARGAPQEGAWLTLLAILLDGVDGKVARFMDAASEFGLALDSFADFVTFGVAPAFLVFGAAGGLSDSPPLAATVAGSAFLLASVVRVARYTAVEHDAFPGLFRGLPMPAASSLAAVLVLTSPPESWPVRLPAAAILLSGAMLSSWFYVPREWSVQGRGWRPFKWIAGSTVAGLILFRTAPTVVGGLILAWWLWGGALATRAARAQPSPRT